VIQLWYWQDLQIFIKFCALQRSTVCLLSVFKRNVLLVWLNAILLCMFSSLNEKVKWKLKKWVWFCEPRIVFRFFCTLKFIYLSNGESLMVENCLNCRKVTTKSLVSNVLKIGICIFYNNILKFTYYARLLIAFLVPQLSQIHKFSCFFLIIAYFVISS